jgi:hypothetical protein
VTRAPAALRSPPRGTGAEDAGLPPAIVRACAHCISLDGVRASSYNVATAGTLIMYDRCRKLGGPPSPSSAAMPLELDVAETLRETDATPRPAPGASASWEGQIRET